MASKRAAVLDARHLIASANGAVLQGAGAVTRALAWQLGDEVSVINSLETALENLAAAQRQLHEAITELRIATRTET